MENNIPSPNPPPPRAQHGLNPIPSLPLMGGRYKFGYKTSSGSSHSWDSENLALKNENAFNNYNIKMWTVHGNHPDYII